MKNRTKLLALTLLISVMAVSSGSLVEAGGARGDRGGGEDFGAAYCQYFKTKAMFAGHKARASSGAAKKVRRANALWKKYNACMKSFGRHTNFRAPTY